MSSLRATQWTRRGPSASAATQRRVVEVEPARPRRLRAVRIDGDDLEIEALAEPQQRVVRAHRGVPAAGARRAAGQVADVLDAFGERRRGDDQVIGQGRGSVAMRQSTARRRAGNRRSASSPTVPPPR